MRINRIDYVECHSNHATLLHFLPKINYVECHSNHFVNFLSQPNIMTYYTWNLHPYIFRNWIKEPGLYIPGGCMQSLHDPKQYKGGNLVLQPRHKSQHVYWTP
jgi:hypothetical protein